MIVVFLDVKNEQIRVLSDKGEESFEFLDVGEVADLIGKKRALYITDAIEVTGDQLISTVNQLITNSAKESSEMDDLDGKTFFLQSQAKGVLCVQDAGITFNGPGDCKQIDAELTEVIKESAILRLLIKQKKILVIDYATMRRSSRKQNKHRDKTSRLIQSAKDKELDSILVKDDAPGSAADLADNLFSRTKDDVETTDITDSIINDPTERMSEAEIAEAMRQGKIGI